MVVLFKLFIFVGLWQGFNTFTSNCLISNPIWEAKKKSLEQQYLEKSHNVTILFGHVHHAGGTAICLLARNNTVANPNSNCNHPREFRGTSPTTGSIQEQLLFQRSTPWKFYAVELKMPRNLIFGGPFLYSIVLRNPYVLFFSQYRRAVTRFSFNGTLTQFAETQLSRVGTANLDLNKMHSSISDNYFRGQVGFLLGRYGPTNRTDDEIMSLAIKRLQRFSVIILTEYMRETGILFQFKFGWNLDHFGKTAVNSHGPMSTLLQAMRGLSPSEVHFIRRHCNLDMKLYQYAKCLVERDLAVYNASLPSQLNQYDEANSIFLT
jgi:hypothetical protein